MARYKNLQEKPRYITFFSEKATDTVSRGDTQSSKSQSQAGQMSGALLLSTIPYAI